MENENLVKAIKEVQTKLSDSQNESEQANVIVKFLQTLSQEELLQILSDEYFEKKIPRIHYNLVFEDLNKSEEYIEKLKQIVPSEYEYVLRNIFNKYHISIDQPLPTLPNKSKDR